MFRPVSVANQRLLDGVLERTDLLRREPHKIYPWFVRPCRVRTLLVTDGGLDFGGGDFGLSTFVSILLNDTLNFVRFELTLAHLSSDVSDGDVMAGEAGIARSIKDFRFDEPDHFTPELYDEVWLFGIETSLHRSSYATRDGDHDRYPADRLGDAELAALSAFMNGGGGLFATGDHGRLGRCLGGSVSRARSMRLWDHTSANNDLDQVSMGGPRRNDTNRPGDPGTQFDDQSDDIPQTIEPLLYSAWVSPFFKARWPHPVLCGPRGVIRVLPDHPHEGECVEPGDLSATYEFDGSPEYPPATDGSGPIEPEVIATSSVPAGNTAGTKDATVAHSFGAIGAYDGHRAGVGRVVTDATWHHFVNINLVGEIGIPETEVKGRGFLASAAGEAHLEDIKAYYRNIAVWIAPPGRHVCFRSRLTWSLLHEHRVVEAVFTHPDLSLDKAHVSHLYELGAHARDVLGKRASRCQSRQWILDVIWEEIPELIPEIDPWYRIREPIPPRPPFVNPEPLIDIALGGALLALREEFQLPREDVTDILEERAPDLIARGATVAIHRGVEALTEASGRYAGGGGKRTIG